MPMRRMNLIQCELDIFVYVYAQSYVALHVYVLDVC